MVDPKTIFRIRRFKPNGIDPPQYQDFVIQPQPEMTVLDGLEQIRLTLDATLMYRHCCHHASCGTCACTINGTAALACNTRIDDLHSATITLTPLENHTCLGDLVVDMTAFFKEMDPDWAGRRQPEAASVERIPQGVARLLRFENCIECGCCVSVCPVVPSNKGFMGPAALAAIHNEMRNAPDNRKPLLKIAAGARGVGQCQRALACSRVCPSKVYPARHIADLVRAISG